jgi:hypothetical protein
MLVRDFGGPGFGGDSSARECFMDMSSEQGRCSIVEPEPDLCFGTHLTGALTPQGGATSLFVPANP